MIKTTLFIVFTTLFSTVYSQENFQVKSIGSSYSIEFLNEAFGKADFCGMLYRSERRQITLNDGAVIELLSADDLSDSSDNCVCQKTLSHNHDLWRLSDSGHVLRVIPTSQIKLN